MLLSESRTSAVAMLSAASGAPVRDLVPSWGCLGALLGLLWRPLLQVSLDGVGLARLSLVGARARVSKCSPLAQQVPADVEFELDRAKALSVSLKSLGAVSLLAVAQLVLLLHEALDACRDLLVADGLMLGLLRAEDPLGTASAMPPCAGCLPEEARRTSSATISACPTGPQSSMSWP